MSARNYIGWVILALLAVPLGASASGPAPVSLVVGKGWAVVREMRTVALKRGEQDLVLDGIPAEADLSSLMLRTRRAPIDLLHWSREDEVPSGVLRASGISLDQATGSAHWDPGVSRERTTTRERGAQVRCLIDSRFSGKRPVAVTYLVRGFDWEARYQVVLRGELENDAEPISVDLLGTTRIRNPTTRIYADADILLVTDGSPDAVDRPAEEVGFLMLDQDELTSPWRGGHPEAEAEAGFTFHVPERARVGAAGHTDVALVRSQRTPADRLYVMRAAQFPIGVGAMKPLRKYISFHHRTKGASHALPPGKAQIFLGTRRTHLLQEGRLPRTEAEGEIRIDLGRESDVLGIRRSTGIYPALEGFREEGFEVVVSNRRASEIRVELLEEPPLRLDWHVVQATERHDIAENGLRFSPRIGAESQKRIFYRLRLRQAGL